MNTIDDQAREYADTEFARIDDPALSDMELWERYLGIDDAETRRLFDAREALKATGTQVDPLFNENEPGDHPFIPKMLYAEHAARLRNPRPTQPDPESDKLDAIVTKEAFSRDALKSLLFRQRRDVLRAERDAEEAERIRLAKLRALLASPVTIEGTVIRPFTN